MASLADTADRMVRSLAADGNEIWLDGGCRRFEPRSVLRLTLAEHVGVDGELRTLVPFELVVVREVRSPYAALVDRAQFGTQARDYPPGSLVDVIATSPRERDRPIYHGFEDV